MGDEVAPRLQHRAAVEREREDASAADDRHDVSLLVQLKLRVDAEVVFQRQSGFIDRTTTENREGRPPRGDVALLPQAQVKAIYHDHNQNSRHNRTYTRS